MSSTSSPNVLLGDPGAIDFERARFSPEIAGITNSTRGNLIRLCRNFVSFRLAKLPASQGCYADSEIEGDRSAKLAAAKGIRGAPNFVIEVLSPSTAAFDTIEKRKA